MRIAFAAATAALFVATAAQAAPTTYPGWQITQKYTTRATAGPCNFNTAITCGYANYARATSSVIYDSATDTYTVRDTGSTAIKSSFGPANISSSDATYVTYSKNSGAETFRILNTGGVNPLIELSYANYGKWRRTSTSGALTNVNDTYLVWGSKTPASAITSGTGSYSTVLDGTFVNKDGVFAVSGSGTFDANFGAGTISYSSTATGTPEASGSPINFGTLTGAGRVARGNFAGTGTTNGSGYAMDVNGTFYGPAAEEMGGVFTLRGNKGNGVGAIVGN
jgi:hypothetical protein